jgi:asparagine synthase (glutamine-hydrolysing)
MCGLTALFSYGRNAPMVDSAELEVITDSMVMRGPDGRGIWLSGDKRVGLGHRRLSIIDLSERASQPMEVGGQSQVGSKYYITYNGEIYNFRELREDLKSTGVSFLTDSDTEVIARLYERYGSDMLSLLRGMFAFAIWDENKRELFLARDPYGIKPLYYSDNGQVFRAASQVKALIAGRNIDTSLDPAGHTGFFLFGSVPEPHTFYKNITALPAGHFLRVRSNGKHVFKCYFNIKDKLQIAKETLKPINIQRAIVESLEHHFVSDVPVGMFLSSGIDSASLVALASEFSGNDLQTITLGFKEYRGTLFDEVPFAESIARRYRATHSTVNIGYDDFDNSVESILAAMDQPTIDGVNTYFVAKAAKEAGLKVAISGLGGDELFGGYNTFKDVPSLVNKVSKIPGHQLIGKVIRTLFSSVAGRVGAPKIAGVIELGGSFGGAYLLRRGLFMPWELPKIIDPDLAREGLSILSPVEKLNESCESIKEPLRKLALLETIFYMRNQLLRDADWAGMSQSVEIRLPLVDSFLFEILAPVLLRSAGASKLGLSMMPSHALPKAIIEREKTGFFVPIEDWLRKRHNSHDHGLRGWAKMVYASAIKA